MGFLILPTCALQSLAFLEKPERLQPNRFPSRCKQKEATNDAGAMRRHPEASAATVIGRRVPKGGDAHAFDRAAIVKACLT